MFRHDKLFFLASLMIWQIVARGLDITIDFDTNQQLFLPPVNNDRQGLNVIRTTEPKKIDLPPVPEPLQKETLKPTIKNDPLIFKATLPRNDLFPELPCLKENVKFWERIYSQVDTNQVVLHDKFDLRRIYGIYSLPSRGQRFFYQEKKKAVEKSLIQLSKKISTPSHWTSHEKVLAQLFSNGELTSQNLLNAAQHLRFQQGLKSQFMAGLRRSYKYQPLILPILRKQQLPDDLSFLPHVESSYNNAAGSKVGARGLWQLMPETMRLLEGAGSVSKRGDPTLATVAASKLLKDNYLKTQSWPLALSAYNHGLGGILRAVETTGSHNLCLIIHDYHSPSFKFASTNFYAQFLAARRVVKSHQLHYLTHKNISTRGSEIQ